MCVKSVLKSGNVLSLFNIMVIKPDSAPVADKSMYFLMFTVRKDSGTYIRTKDKPEPAVFGVAFNVAARVNTRC